jgi:hypothetical protein
MAEHIERIAGRPILDRCAAGVLAIAGVLVGLYPFCTYWFFG